jgi:hypothetical protein
LVKPNLGPIKLVPTSWMKSPRPPENAAKHKGVVLPKHKHKQMVLWLYPPTPRQLVVTACFFVTGASLFAVGVHLSFANIGPQQARAKARSDVIKDRLRKMLDD